MALIAVKSKTGVKKSMDMTLVVLVFAATFLVALADALTKKVAQKGSVGAALRDPLILAVLVLYLVQIAVLFWVYLNGGLLGIVGNLQTVFLSIIVVLAGALFFGERLTAIQLGGVAFGLLGAVMMNWPA